MASTRAIVDIRMSMDKSQKKRKEQRNSRRKLELVIKGYPTDFLTFPACTNSMTSSLDCMCESQTKIFCDDAIK